VNSERIALVCGFVLLFAGGTALKPLAREPDGAVEDGVWSVLGSYRPLAADWFWLETDLAWERRDAAGTRYLIGLTLAADPHSQYFWLNSARMLAYDLPSWSDDAPGDAGPAVRVHRRKVAAGESLRLLERGLRWHPDSEALHLEMANICLYALGDRARAAAHYRVVAAQPDAPAYAARIYRRLQEPRR
jgi:hypothetical protein